MSSPQSLDKEQEDMRANPIKGCWSVSPNSLMVGPSYLGFDNALLNRLLTPEEKEFADGLLDG